MKKNAKKIFFTETLFVVLRYSIQRGKRALIKMESAIHITTGHSPLEGISIGTAVKQEVRHRK